MAKDETVQILREGVDALQSVASAVTARAAPGHDQTGGTVASLTEAVMGMTSALVMIATAIQDVADAIRGGDER